MARHTAVGLGEVLWDLLPSGKQLGGAPANFAYISTLLGEKGVVASRLGKDALGKEACQQIHQLGVATDYLQWDPHRDTGTVTVTLDAAGQAQFAVVEPVAWDSLEWTPSWEQLAKSADAVCFGSLAQRAGTSRATIHNFLSASPQAVKIFDVNLRQSLFSREVLAESMELADIVKLNHEELLQIAVLFGCEATDECSWAQALLRTHDLKLVCVTRGHRGSLLVGPDGTHEHPGFAVKVADTVGAGDAFTAALVYEFLRGSSLEAMNETANRAGAWVASRVGATPVPAGNLEEQLAMVG